MISSVAQPVLSQLSESQNRQQSAFRKMLRFTAYLSFPAMFGLALIAPEFIYLTIQDKWMPCVPILQILCIWGAFLPITTLCSNLIISKGKSNIYMWNTIGISIMQIIAIVLIHQWGIHMMIAIYSSLNIIWLFIWLYLINKEIGLTVLNAIKDITPFVSTAALSILLSYLITLPIKIPIFVLLTKIVTTAILYLGTMQIIGLQIQKEIFNYLVKHKITEQ